MAAVPEFGRAARIEPSVAPGVEQTRDLFERFAGQIYGYCLHQLGSREEAEDAVQTTFMNVFRGLQRGIVPRVEGAWLFKIAHNVCLSRRRSTHRRGRVETPNNFEVLQDIVPARERGADELIRLHDALEGMPETQRRAILLREWRGLSYREIADELQLSQGAVETLIFRARRTLAAGLKQQGEGTSWRRRSQYSIDAGGVLAAAKTLFGGATTMKVAAIAVVATTAVASADLSQPHSPPMHRVRLHARVGTPAVVHVSRNATRVHLAPVTASVGHTRTRPHVSPRGSSPSSQAPARRFVPHESVDNRAPSTHAPAASAAIGEAATPAAAPPHERPGPKAAAPAPKQDPPALGHAKHAQAPPPTPAAPDQHPTPPAQPAPPGPADQAAPQATHEHGPATAPGQQEKVDHPAPLHGNGH